MRTTRRSFIQSAAFAAAALRLHAAAGPLFNYSICNEVFDRMEFTDSCKLAKKMGYAGIEIAPFTLAGNIDEISASRRKEMRNILQSEGLRFAGMHWLLVTPAWLHITTGDKDVRERSWQYLNKLVDFCGVMGGAVMVLGSPKQRGTTPGTSREDAVKYLTEGLKRMGPHAAARKATISLEALDHSQTDVINTLAEAVAVVKAVNEPAIQTMFDYHNVPDEKEPSEVLVRRYFPMIRHIHINEMDGRHPGTGHYDFLPVLRVLKEKNYKGWVSLEVFPAGYAAAKEKMDPQRIGTEAMAYIRKLEAQLL